MVLFLEVLIGGLALGLPVWFAFLDRGVFPRAKWVGEGEPAPLWARMVVVVGVVLVFLVALSSPISGFDQTH